MAPHGGVRRGGDQARQGVVRDIASFQSGGRESRHGVARLGLSQEERGLGGAMQAVFGHSVHPSGGRESMARRGGDLAWLSSDMGVAEQGNVSSDTAVIHKLGGGESRGEARRSEAWTRFGGAWAERGGGIARQ